MLQNRRRNLLPVLTEKERPIYQKLREEMGCDMVPGSLAEIEMIQDWFEGNVTVYRLDDEWRDEEKMLLEGFHEKAESAITNRRVLIEKDQRDRVTPRWLTPWVRKQQRRMLGDLHYLQIREQLRRRWFCKMEWEGRPIENIYFNLEKRKVYLQLSPPQTLS